MDKKQVSISIKYIDSNLYEKLANIAKSKNCKSNSKTDILNFIFKDYVDMHDLNEFKNPYLIDHMERIISNECKALEKRLGGRLFTLVGEESIAISVLSMIVYQYMNKYTDTEETDYTMKQFREKAVENVRERSLSPLSYIDLIKQGNGD